MTVKLATTIHRYVGLSDDVKPTPGLLMDGRKLTAADVPVGSTFLEADTNEVWHWTGQDWRLGDTREVRELKALNGQFAEVVNEFRILRHALELSGIATEIDEPTR